MGINALDRRQKNVFGFEVTGKLTPQELQGFLPTMEAAVLEANKRLRLLINVTEMQGANIKSEWEVFEFLKKTHGRHRAHSYSRRAFMDAGHERDPF